MATSAPSIFPALAQLDIGDVLAHMPGGFFVYHADGDETVVYVNEACRASSAALTRSSSSR